MSTQAAIRANLNRHRRLVQRYLAIHGDRLTLAQAARQLEVTQRTVTRIRAELRQEAAA